ncbi:MAG: type II toxin-antitoxin system RelB/DinJ family antitoxin [Hespellia sp.]|jgi:DNA-damage-inducible protein J|nr:type II toxin-antitoxin system RelB/DinJ family antitoxin [Hespellia sp.]
MATTNINVRVDTELKQSAETLFLVLGLTMSSAITMFLKSAVSHDGIPFEVKRIPNVETRAALIEYEEMKKNPGNYKVYGDKEVISD